MVVPPGDILSKDNGSSFALVDLVVAAPIPGIPTILVSSRGAPLELTYSGMSLTVEKSKSSNVPVQIISLFLSDVVTHAVTLVCCPPI